MEEGSSILRSAVPFANSYLIYLRGHILEEITGKAERVESRDEKHHPVDQRTQYPTDHRHLLCMCFCKCVGFECRTDGVMRVCDASAQQQSKESYDAPNMVLASYTSEAHLLVDSSWRKQDRLVQTVIICDTTSGKEPNHILLVGNTNK